MTIHYSHITIHMSYVPSLTSIITVRKSLYNTA